MPRAKRHAARHAARQVAGIMSRAAAQADGVELHQHDAPQELLGQSKFSRRGNAMFSNTDMSLNRPEFLEHHPHFGRSA